MLLLTTQALPQMAAHAHPNLGRLLTPRHYSRAAEQPAALPWAADNDCFTGLDERAWRAMLDAIASAPRRSCLFATAPDVVGDARATAALFDRYAHEIERRGLPLALVLQDGLDELPAWLARVWPRLAAVFVGGSTDFKLGEVAAGLVREAKRRGCWAHMGRVNSYRRLTYADAIGCDSADGTQWVRFRTHYLDAGLAHCASLAAQSRLAV